MLAYRLHVENPKLGIKQKLFLNISPKTQNTSINQTTQGTSHDDSCLYSKFKYRQHGLDAEILVKKREKNWHKSTIGSSLFIKRTVCTSGTFCFRP